MLVKVVCALVLLLPSVVLSAERGSKCITPNGEAATCTTINSCKLLKDAIRTGNASLVDFARESQCGYDSEPLICCGTVPFKSPRGSSCVTPEGVAAKCIPVTSCKFLIEGIRARDRATIELARRSQCGYDFEALVCCGSEKTASVVSRLLPDRTQCGLEKEKDRVFGGLITEIDEFPWMALLRYRNSDDSDAGFKCGGTLINKRYVLTAAHCVVINTNAGFELDSVRLGEWRISTTKDCDEGLVNEECADPVVDLKIEEMLPNRQYVRNLGKNDIALLRLERNVVFSNYIQPICLLAPDAPDPEEGSKFFVAGWGSTENSSSSDTKLKVEVPLFSRSSCSEKIKQRGPITEDQICAGGVEGKDSCLGDSGGPLMGQFSKPDVNARAQWYQEGIISWGVVCGKRGYPGVYGRVSKYINWIAANMKPF